MQADGHRCLIMRSFYEFHRKKKLKPVLMEARNKYDSATQFRIPECSNEAAKICRCSFFSELIARSFHANRVPVIFSDVT